MLGFLWPTGHEAAAGGTRSNPQGRGCSVHWGEIWDQCLLSAKLASETASCKDLLEHCSTTVSKQLLSRLDTQIARGKTEVSPHL